MRTMVALIAVFSITSIAWSQDDPFGGGSLPSKSADPFAGESADPFAGEDDTPRPTTRQFRDPFDINVDAEGLGGEEDHAVMEMMSGSQGPSHDDRFRIGLQKAITALKKAKSDQERKALEGFIVQAFSDRYDRIIASRKKDLERLKKQIASLEQDLSRREAAKSRVIQVQLQSVQLAVEGVLELNELQGVSPYPGGGMEGGMYEMGLGN